MRNIKFQKQVLEAVQDTFPKSKLAIENIFVCALLYMRNIFMYTISAGFTLKKEFTYSLCSVA